MIGAATPTVCPSVSWNQPFTTRLGLTVVKVALTGVAWPSRPTTEPVQV